MERLAAGTQFGPYTIEGYIAGGGMGQVYAARNAVYGSPVALKVLHDKYRGDEGWRLRFHLEGVIGQQLKHPNVLSARELIEHDDKLAIVMDLVRGCQTLDQVMHREFPEGLQPATALRVFLGILQGVEYAHERNVVHGDLKPENVLVSGEFSSPENWSCLVTDFGTVGLIAHPVLIDGRTAVVATPRYSSPEHLYGVDHLEPRSDLYALGLVLHFLLTSKHASTARTVQEAAERVTKPLPLVNLVDLPDSVISLFQTATAVDPASRFAGCRDFALAVREVLDAMGERLQLEDLSADLATEVMDERIRMKKEQEAKDQAAQGAPAKPDSGPQDSGSDSQQPTEALDVNLGFAADFPVDPTTEDEEATELMTGGEVMALMAKMDKSEPPEQTTDPYATLPEPVAAQAGAEQAVAAESGSSGQGATAQAVATESGAAAQEDLPPDGITDVPESDPLPELPPESAFADEPDQGVSGTSDGGPDALGGADVGGPDASGGADASGGVTMDDYERSGEIPMYVWVVSAVAIALFAVVCGFGLAG